MSIKGRPKPYVTLTDQDLEMWDTEWNQFSPYGLLNVMASMAHELLALRKDLRKKVNVEKERQCPSCRGPLEYLGRVQSKNQLKYACRRTGQLWYWDHVFHSWRQ